MKVISAALLASFLAFAAASQEDFSAGIVTSLKHCLQTKDKMDCLKRKVIEKIDSEMNGNRTFYITDEVVLARDPSWTSENSVARSLKSDNINDLLWAKINDYIKSSVVQFKMNGETEEGRRHKKGQRIYMLAAVGMAGVLAHIFFGKLALISGLALLTAKVALMLSVIIGLKKLVSGSGGHAEHVVYTSSDHGHHGGWSRSTVAQELAYRGYKPKAGADYQGNYYQLYEDPRGEIEAQ